MALSQRDPDRHDGWMTSGVSVYTRRRRAGMLTPYGWFIVLSVLSLAAGATLAFLT